MNRAETKRQHRIQLKKDLTAWSLKIRSTGKCAICGTDRFLNAHHILPKEGYPDHRLDLNNGICLCVGCHKFGKFSAHKNPIFFSEWLKSHYPHLYDWAVIHLK